MASVVYANAPLTITPGLLVLVVAASVLFGLAVGWFSHYQYRKSESTSDRKKHPYDQSLVSTWSGVLHFGEALWEYAQGVQSRLLALSEQNLSWQAISSSSAVPQLSTEWGKLALGESPFKRLRSLVAKPSSSVNRSPDVIGGEPRKASDFVVYDNGSQVEGESPSPSESQLIQRGDHESARPSQVCELATPEGATWVSEEDLEKFCSRLEGDEDVTEWSHMGGHETKGMKFDWWRRDPKVGPTEYKLRSVWENCSPELIRDFYWDDPHRMTWDPMLSSVRTLSQCPKTGAQIVHWVRKFPLFCKDREYVIARRIWSHGNTYYCITKGMEHPEVPKREDPRRIDFFNSCWRISPLPGNRSECLLLHHEDLGIQRDLAKFAVKHGMWGAVRKSSPGLRILQSRQEDERAGGDGPQARSVSWADLHTPILPRNQFGRPRPEGRLKQVRSSMELVEESDAKAEGEETQAKTMKRWVSFPDLVGRPVTADALPRDGDGEEGEEDEAGVRRWSISCSTPDSAEMGSGLSSTEDGSCSRDSDGTASTSEPRGPADPSSLMSGSDRVVRGLMALDGRLSESVNAEANFRRQARSRRRRIGWIVGTSVLALLCGVETGILVKILLANAVKHAIFSPNSRKKISK